jgi:cellulose synthase/poly-beta-1,6-N-acetylglucosamine synthase-like glycosyltransferase
MSITSFLFWSSLVGVVYAYLGYPLMLKLLTLFVKGEKTGPIAISLPKVTLLVSVFNEEQVIEEKILNALDLDYPRDLLELVFVSDGSNDRTDAIISRYADRGVQLCRYEGRIGKTACLNQAVPLACGEIVVFSDANSKYDRGVIRALVKHFADDRIGFVTGRTRYLSPDGGKIRESVGVYSRIESEIKRLESLVGSCVGADGAVFAIRKELYRPLQSADINDLVIPLQIVKQGYQGVLEEEAFCFEETAKGELQEFRRQVRITTRTIRAVFNYLSLLNPIRHGLFSFQLFSHKVCRLLVPFFLLTLFITNMVVIFESPFYLVSAIGQVLFYLMAVRGWASGPGSIDWMIALSHTFGMVNLAILFAWVKYIKGETYVTWMPTQR